MSSAAGAGERGAVHTVHERVNGEGGGGAGVAGSVTDDDLGSHQSSGEVETEAMGHGEARGAVLRTPASAVSALVTMVWPVGGRSHVGDELGGGGCSGERGMVHTVQEGVNGEGEDGARLTAVT